MASRPSLRSQATRGSTRGPSTSRTATGPSAPRLKTATLTLRRSSSWVFLESLMEIWIFPKKSSRHFSHHTSFRNNVNRVSSLFQDYFVLVPKEYFEPLILKEDIYDSCLAGATLPYCMQYGYPDISQHPTALSEQHSQRPGGSLGDVYWFDRQASKMSINMLTLVVN